MSTLSARVTRCIFVGFRLLFAHPFSIAHICYSSVPQNCRQRRVICFYYFIIYRYNGYAKKKNENNVTSDKFQFRMKITSSIAVSYGRIRRILSTVRLFTLAHAYT